MSARFRQLFRVMTSTTVLASSILAAALWVSPAVADTLQPFTAVLNGAQETPPVASPSQGVAFLTFNKDNSNLCYAISYSALEGTEILAHFHGPENKGDVAGPGVASPILINITNGSPPGPSLVGSPKNACVSLTDENGKVNKQQVKDLKAGLWYINVHTSPDHLGGEIRGQVLPVNGVKYNVPAIQPPASPSGAFLD
jgi:hypothetical protein